MKKKTAERSAVRWGWVVFAVLFFFGTAVVLELRGFSPEDQKTAEDIADLVRADVLGRDAGGAAEAQTPQISFADELKHKMDEVPSDGLYADTSQAEMLKEKLAGFTSSVFTRDIGFCMELRLDGVKVWDNRKIPAGEARRVSGVGDALRKAVQTKSAPELFYSFPAYTLRLRDLVSEDVYTRVLALDNIAKENEKGLHSALVMLIADSEQGNNLL